MSLRSGFTFRFNQAVKEELRCKQRKKRFIVWSYFIFQVANFALVSCLVYKKCENKV